MMNAPLTLILPTKTISIPYNRTDLEVDSPLLAANSNAQHYTFNRGSLSELSYSDYHFYMEFFEFNLKEKLTAGYTVNTPSFFLFFLLSGNIQFKRQGNERVYEAKDNTCYATTNYAGVFQFHLSEGRHRFFYITPLWEWLKSQGDTYPRLTALSDTMGKGNALCKHLPFCTITSHMKSILLKFCSLNKVNASEGELLALTLNKKLMNLYDKQVLIKLNQPVFRIRTFIESNYANHELTKIESLVKRFYITPKTLERKYLKEFKTTPRKHIQLLRMERSKRLLTEEGLTIKKAAEVTGYEDISSFSRAFKEYYGYSPSNEKLNLKTNSFSNKRDKS